MELVKAWDFKVLGKEVLGTVKAAAAPATGKVLEWVALSCAKSENTVVKIVGGIVVGSTPAILAEVEKAIK